MSIGSVGSITASPMQPTCLSVHSQPSSIPINDQNISPHQNDVSPHPLTPILENNINVNNGSNLSSNNHDQKPDIDDLKASSTTAATTNTTTNVNGQINNKHDNNLLQKQLKQGTNNQDINEVTTKLSNGQTTTAAASSSSSSSSLKENNLKRPALSIRDCEKNDEDDFMINQSLYDYSTWDAW